MSSLTRLPAWQALDSHFHHVKDLTIKDLFAAEPDRFDRFSTGVDGLLLDYSKNRITAETMALLRGLAAARDVEG